MNTLQKGKIMEFKTKTTIKELEEKIEKGYSLKIFKGYVAVEKRGVEKLIDVLYANLPEDVKNAREYLASINHIPAQTSQKKKPLVYESIKDLEDKLDTGFRFASLLILNVKEIEKLIDKIYDNIPQEITEAETLSEE